MIREVVTTYREKERSLECVYEYNGCLFCVSNTEYSLSAGGTTYMYIYIIVVPNGMAPTMVLYIRTSTEAAYTIHVYMYTVSDTALYLLY